MCLELLCGGFVLCGFKLYWCVGAKHPVPSAVLCSSLKSKGFSLLLPVLACAKIKVQSWFFTMVFWDLVVLIVSILSIFCVIKTQYKVSLNWVLLCNSCTSIIPWEVWALTCITKNVASLWMVIKADLQSQQPSASFSSVAHIFPESCVFFFCLLWSKLNHIKWHWRPIVRAANLEQYSV